MLGQSVKKWKADDQRPISLTSRLVSFVADDLMPLSLVESTAFRSYSYESNPAFVMPSRKYMSSVLLPRRAEKVRTDLTERMRQADDISLTLDLWSSRDMRSFVDITGHFVSGFALQTVMVACKRFHGSHTANRIHQVFEETLASYAIQGKISAVVTDNASNMVRAFSLPGLENINELPDPDEVDGEMLQPTGDDLDDFTYDRLSCFIHTLQLTVNDGRLKDVGKLRSEIAKVAALVAHCGDHVMHPRF